MASTVLFAPQVRSVQPAFVYKNNEGTVKIYYTLSEFNSITPTKIRYTVTDPNKASSWGSDSMLKNSEFYEVAYSKDSFDINLNSSAFKVFTLNQYYQVQIQLVSGTEVSAWSQTTLIRPVAEGVLEIDLVDNSRVSSLSRIGGRVKYDLDNSYTEAIDRFSVIIKNSTTGVVVYNSGIVKKHIRIRICNKFIRLLFRRREQIYFNC